MKVFVFVILDHVLHSLPLTNEAKINVVVREGENLCILSHWLPDKLLVFRHGWRLPGTSMSSPNPISRAGNVAQGVLHCGTRLI